MMLPTAFPPMLTFRPLMGPPLFYSSNGASIIGLIILLPQSLGEGEAEFEGHREALEPLGQGWEMADGGDHFGDPAVDVGEAGAAPYLDERDFAVVEDDELDDRHAAALAQRSRRQQIVVLP